MKKWYVYIVNCSDNTLYTGITTDINRRIKEHNGKKGAKYTKKRQPVTLAAFWEFNDRSLASKEEYRIKQLTKLKKLEMINNFKGEL